MTETCLFCRMVAGEIPAARVAEDEHCLAFRDITPQAPHHILVIPKVHATSLNDVADHAIVGRLSAMAVAIARAEGFAESGYRTVMNSNRDGGQTVFHLHMHLLAGRRMAWPPG